MSRLDKHRARREQIKTDGAIQEALGKVSARVQGLRAELDAIDPKIARPARAPTIALLDLLTVDPKRGEDTALIEDFVDSDDFAALSAMRTQAELFIYASAPDGGYEAGWLSSDRGVALLRESAAQYRAVEEANAEFEQKSGEYFKRFGKILSLARRHAQRVDDGGADEEGSGPEPIPAPQGRSAYIPYLAATYGFLALLVLFAALLVALMAV